MEFDVLIAELSSLALRRRYIYWKFKNYSRIDVERKIIMDIGNLWMCDVGFVSYLQCLYKIWSVIAFAIVCGTFWLYFSCSVPELFLIVVEQSYNFS